MLCSICGSISMAEIAAICGYRETTAYTVGECSACGTSNNDFTLAIPVSSSSLYLADLLLPGSTSKTSESRKNCSSTSASEQLEFTRPIGSLLKSCIYSPYRPIRAVSVMPLP